MLIICERDVAVQRILAVLCTVKVEGCGGCRVLETIVKHLGAPRKRHKLWDMELGVLSLSLDSRQLISFGFLSSVRSSKSLSLGIELNSCPV